MAIGIAKVNVIKRYLADGKQRKFIAYRTGVCEKVIRKIARGMYTNPPPGLPPVEPKKQQPRRLFDRRTTPKRCPKCRRLVYMPCLACSLRSDDGQLVPTNRETGNCHYAWLTVPRIVEQY